jgi:hypothetical protein
MPFAVSFDLGAEHFCQFEKPCAAGYMQVSCCCCSMCLAASSTVMVSVSQRFVAHACYCSLAVYPQQLLSLPTSLYLCCQSA